MLEEVARLVVNESEKNLATFIHALETGKLDLASPSGALQASLACPENRLRLYREVLHSGLTITELIIALRSARDTVVLLAADIPEVEVAWTYPGNSRLGLRTTGGVAKDIIDGSRATLLVVGYAISGKPSETGLAAQTMAAIARAAERRVSVTVVLHRKANRELLLRWWQKGMPPLQIFTWPESDDAMASVHAKLLIADRRDALVTSANLTYHGFERNLEMGVRVSGAPAAQIYDRVIELIADGELVPWRD